MSDIQIVKELKPYCFQLEYDIDYRKLMDSLYILMDRIGYNIDTINNNIINSGHNYSLNLTHLPGMTGNDRFLKYTGQHGFIKKAGVSEKDFSEHLSEAQDLYIGQIIHDLYKQHNGKFQGRASLAWLRSNFQFDFHTDPHTLTRYHVPLITNEECYFLLRNTETYRIHMPAGTAWYLDPVNIKHTFVNNSKTPRLHLLLSSGF